MPKSQNYRFFLFLGESVEFIPLKAQWNWSRHRAKVFSSIFLWVMVRFHCTQFYQMLHIKSLINLHIKTIFKCWNIQRRPFSFIVSFNKFKAPLPWITKSNFTIKQTVYQCQIRQEKSERFSIYFLATTKVSFLLELLLLCANVCNTTSNQMLCFVHTFVESLADWLIWYINNCPSSSVPSWF